MNPGAAGFSLRCLLYACLLAPFCLMVRFGLQHFQAEQPTLAYLAAMAVCGGYFFVVVGLASLDRQLLYVHRYYDRVLLYLGGRSYAIYLFHLPGIALGSLLVPPPEVMPAFFAHHRVAYEALRALAAVLVWLPLVELVHRGVEQPGIRLIVQAARLRVQQRPLIVFGAAQDGGLHRVR